MSKKINDQPSTGKNSPSEMPFNKTFAGAKLSGKNLTGNPDSKPWIHNRVSDHDKSQREKGRH